MAVVEDTVVALTCRIVEGIEVIFDSAGSIPIAPCPFPIAEHQ